jgi:phosphatidylserine/phosphatidylglycerophosphate/cardiolipin synthase-like enzyme
MLAAIDGAAREVLLEMYLVSSGALADRFIESLASAGGRGVRVRVLLDGFGSLGLSAAHRNRLIAAGVDLRFYNALSWRKKLRNFLRDHRKLLVVDGRVAFVGGVGLTDEFAGMSSEPPWRDQMVETEGPVIADWQRAFARSWRRCGGHLDARELQADAADALPVRNAYDDRAHGPPGHGTSRVVLSEATGRSLLARGVIRRIDDARTRAWIMSAYFVPSRRFRRAMRRAARRGVDVRLLVPGPKTDHPWVRDAARRFYGKLLRNRVRIFEYQPRVLHGKMIVCDGWVSVGSSNFDRWSFKWNLEANQEVDDTEFAQIVAAVFEADCGQSEELSWRQWPRRAWLHRLRERIAGALDRRLERWRKPRFP